MFIYEIECYYVISYRLYMALQKYELLENIDTTTYDWECRVRAQTVWKGINRETNQYWGINIVFVDDAICHLILTLLFLGIE